MELEIRQYEPSDREALIKLWEECELVVPWNDPGRDIDRKMSYQPELFLVGELEGELVASVMAGYEGHRGWVNYLAVSPALRRRGYGRVMMDAAETLLRQVDAPKINLQVRDSNRAVIEFYEAIGYKVEPIVNMGKRLVSDE